MKSGFGFADYLLYVDRKAIGAVETTSMNDLFDRMSTQELEACAQTGALPEWFKATVEASE
jgi:hypothetical protein